MATKKVSLIASFAIIAVAAILVWAVGTPSLSPDPAKKKSAIDAAYSDDADKNNTAKTTSDTPDAMSPSAQPPSAITLQALLDRENEKQTPTQEGEQLEKRIVKLDQTLNTLDPQLADQGINPPDQNTDTPSAEPRSSPMQRLQAIRDHINKTHVE